MAPRLLAQLIGATWHYELRVELAAVLALACRVRRLGINDAPLRLAPFPDPDPNPLQVHLAHSRTQNASSGAISLRPRNVGVHAALSRERVGQRKGEREGHAALAPGWTLAVPYVKPPQYLDCTRRRRSAQRCFHGRSAEARPLSDR